MRNVNDEVAFAKFQETIDGPSLAPPRRPREVLPLKQFGCADQHDLLRHDAEPSFKVANNKVQSRTARRQLAPIGCHCWLVQQCGLV